MLNDTEPSKAMGQWMPVGSLWYAIKGSRGYTIVTLNYWGGEQLKAAMDYAKSQGWVPLSEVMPTGNISLVPQNQTNQIACPKHGTSKLKPDKGGKGYYCSARENGGFCGWQSWKG